MFCRVLFAGLWVLLLASACSSTSTNEGSGGGGGGSSCAGKAAECFACCSDANPGANGAYVSALNEAICVGSPGTCEDWCKCPSPGGLACASCAEAAIQSAIDNECKGECFAFRACLKTCL